MLVYIVLIFLAVGIVVELVKFLGTVIVWVVGFGVSFICIYLLFDLFTERGASVLQAFLLIGAIVLIVLVTVLLRRKIPSIIEREKTHKEVEKYSNWLDAVGIGAYKNSPGNKACWQKAITLRRAIQINDEYAISVYFSEQVVTALHRIQLIRQTDLWNVCTDISPEFQIAESALLMQFLQSKNQVVILTPINMQKYYMTPDILLLFEQVLLNNPDIIRISDFKLFCSEYESLIFVETLNNSVILEILRHLAAQNDDIVASKAKQLLTREHSN